MFNLGPLQQAMLDLAQQRRAEFETTKDIRFQWSANLLDRFAEEIATMPSLGDMDQLDQAIAADFDGRFMRKAKEIFSELGFARHFVHAGFLAKTILDGEPRRPTSDKAEEIFAKMVGLPGKG